MLKDLFTVFHEEDTGTEIGGSESVEETVENNELSGEEDLIKAIQSLMQDDEEIEQDEEGEESEPDEDLEEDSEEIEEAEEEVEDVQEDTGKKAQSKEENAKFAAQRRQKEMEEKVQAEIEKLKQQSPEFALAKQLSDMYGTTPDEILKQMKEAQLQKEAQEKNVPVELLKERQADHERMEALEQELNQIRFQSWQTQIKADGDRLMNEYKVLTQEDIDAATNYILNVARNVNLPLEDAVYAVHGKKIIDSLANAKVQDKLADESGRKKKTPPAPNNGKPSKVVSATAEEKYIAKQMGISIEDYLKYKQ